MKPKATYFHCPHCGDILCDAGAKLIADEGDIPFYRCSSCSNVLERLFWPPSKE